MRSLESTSSRQTTYLYAAGIAGGNGGPLVAAFPRAAAADCCRSTCLARDGCQQNLPRGGGDAPGNISASDGPLKILGWVIPQWDAALGLATNVYAGNLTWTMLTQRLT